MAKRCIFSGATEGLNTSMVVKLDDGRVVEAWISDDFLEIATPSKVKEAVQNQEGKQQEIEALIAKAKELGLTLVPGDAPAAVQPNSPMPSDLPPQPPPMPESPIEAWEPSKGNRIVDGIEADNKKVSIRASGTASALGESVAGAGNEYDINSVDKPSEDLRSGDKVEIGKAKGREGIDIAIPVVRRGKTGETKVSIVDTGGDVALQRRFKAMADQSQSPSGPPDFKQGYQVRTVQCSLCNGTGKLMGGSKDCPKCDGVGMLDVPT